MTGDYSGPDVPWLLLAAGARADVFEVGRDRVLRRAHERGWSAQATAYAARLARRGGVPTPRVLSVEGPDLVLERVPGSTMLDLLVTESIDPATAMSTLADLHRAVHRIEPPASGPLARRRRGSHLLHLDLHPNNVLIGPEGPRVIDWENAAVGAAGLDVAVTAVILACYALAYPSDRPPDTTELLRLFLEFAEPVTDLDSAVEYRRSRTAFMPAAEAAQLDNAAGLIRYLSDRSSPSR